MKKAQKNKARLPRTAGLRTLSEMSQELKKAGLDPSSIEERAHMLAKVEIARQQLSKRKRNGEGDEDEDMEMDYEDEEDWEDEEMDVDEDESVPRKKKRTESGAVAITNKRVPRSNRQLAGLRDADVRRVSSFPWRCDPDMFSSIARGKSQQASQLWPASTESACQGWGGRSGYQNQNGMSNMAYASGCGS